MSTVAMDVDSLRISTATEAPPARPVKHNDVDANSGDSTSRAPSGACASDEERDESDGESFETAPGQPFAATRCLFCNQLNPTLDDNLFHMLKVHGLFIPKKDLHVDIEILIAYCHLIIFGYCECLYCGTQRNNFGAVQQHMVAKGHCKIDVSEDSEFYDFYDPEMGFEDSEKDSATPTKQLSSPSVQLDDTTLRLSSGKIISHRAAGKQRPQPHRHPDMDGLDSRPAVLEKLLPSSQPAPARAACPSTSRALTTRAERRESAFANQLVHLRAEDRRSLMHLPSSEQRAILATQTKQLDKARKAEMRLRARVESMGNKTLMKHFVMDVPGRPNG